MIEYHWDCILAESLEEQVDDNDLGLGSDAETRGGGTEAGGDDERAVAGGMATIVVAKEEWLENLHREDLPRVSVSREGKVYPANCWVALPVLARSVLQQYRGRSIWHLIHEVTEWHYVLIPSSVVVSPDQIEVRAEPHNTVTK